MVITLQQLKNITGISEAKLNLYLPYINQYLVKYEVNTPLRISHFLAQILHESGSFRYVEELASGDAYDTRVDLGNTPEKDGDGRKFKGRGLIQITGKSNYIALSKDLGYDFINDVEALEKPQYAVASAFWFWNKKKLNLLADNDDIKTITKRINGGLNGFADRQNYLIKCKKEFIKL